MTDIDRLLTDDGVRWRAAQPPAPDPDPALLTRPGRSRWQPLAAAAAVVVVAAGAIGVVAARRDAERPATPAAAGYTPAPVDTIVRDGDRVRGEGLVVALPGAPVRLCTGSRPDTGPVATPRSAGGLPPESCPVGVTLVGVDLDRLTDRQEQSGAVWGTAEVTGVYRAGTVTVTAQAIRSTDAGKGLSPALPADCPVPPGGWPRREVQSLPGIGQAGQYVAAHPDVLASVSIGYPEPTPSGRVGTQVLLVGTTGDVGSAIRAVRRFYAGSLCVRKVAHSRTQLQAARAVLTAAFTDPAQRARYGLLGDMGEGVDGGEPYTTMAVVVYTAAADDLRHRAGTDLVRVDPLLRVLS
jgi:hypothetical protein